MDSDRVRVAVGIYGTLAFLAWGVSRALGGSVWELTSTPSPWWRWGLAVAAGGAAGALLHWGSGKVASRTRLGRTLRAELAGATRGLGARAAFLLAVASSVGEEAAFRGLLLPSLRGHLGTAGALLLSSLLFGLVHVPRSRAGILWSAMAAVAGLALGGVYLATGLLLAPIVAHAVVNYVNLRDLARG